MFHYFLSIQTNSTRVVYMPPLEVVSNMPSCSDIESAFTADRIPVPSVSLRTDWHRWYSPAPPPLLPCSSALCVQARPDSHPTTGSRVTRSQAPGVAGVPPCPLARFLIPRCKVQRWSDNWLAGYHSPCCIPPAISTTERCTAGLENPTETAPQ